MKTHPSRHLMVLILAAAMLFGSVRSNAQAGGVALGAALVKLGDQVDQVVADTKNSGNAVVQEAARNLAILIANMRNAYEDSLNTTVETLSPQIKGGFDQAQQLVDDLKTGSLVDIQKISVNAQGIVNTLPFRNSEPQLRDVTPHFVVPSKTNYQVPLRFTGNFVNAGKPGYEPKLTIDATTFDASAVTTDQIEFDVPVTTLFASSSVAAQDKLSFQRHSILLSIPWKSGILGLKKTDSFKAFLTALPPFPGHLTIIKTVTRSIPTQTRVSVGNFHQCSTRECGNGDDKDHHWCAAPNADAPVPIPFSPGDPTKWTFVRDDGWHVVQGTSSVGIGSRQGDTSGPNFVSDSGNQVCYSATTIHHGVGHSGSIDFSISFTQATTIEESADIPQDLALSWGDSKAIDLPIGSWKLIFDSFDGHHYEFKARDSSNKFITLTDQAGTVIVGTQDPATLIWP